jgi:hypothetical protein
VSFIPITGKWKWLVKINLAHIGLRYIAVLGLAALAFPVQAAAQNAALVELDDFGPRQVKSQSFALASAQDLQIDAVGAESTGKGGKTNWAASMWERNGKAVPPWSGNAWIIDLQSRKVVWELSEAATSQGARGLREFKGGVALAAGSYTAYYASFPDGEYWTDDSAKQKTDRKWHWFGDDPVESFKLTVHGNGRILAAADVDRLRAADAPSTVLSLRGKFHEQLDEAGFVLTKPTEIQIAAEGEAREDGEFDFGWIINADTRAPVWRFTWRDSQPAGGAPKNRRITTSLLLPAGRYAAFYATDDSHDPSEWNAQPPHDPEAWGLILTVTDRDARAAVKTFPYEHVPQNATIVALVGVGNGAMKKQGFTLTRPMDVRIYALGEGRSGRMFDYGWITSGESRKRVWTMEFEATAAAGGDRKNRLVDTIIHLDAGSYVVHYTSDDSHSAEEWNAAAPPDGRRWGITVLAAKGPLDRAAILPYDEKRDPAILAALTGVRDDEQARKNFSLDRDTDVRIYAVGEGSGGDMVDFGWIEDPKSGRRVWEMTYRVTEHAGGAKKNRKFDGVIRLPAGDYVLRYETDSSHSFGDWNAAPPDDPEAWGITVYRK